MSLNGSIQETFDVLTQIKEVEVSAFFSHKVLQKIENKKEEQEKVFSWFTPKLQLASFVLILLLNVSAIFYTFNNNVESNTTIETFAVDYNLQSENTSILN